MITVIFIPAMAGCTTRGDLNRDLDRELEGLQADLENNRWQHPTVAADVSCRVTVAVIPFDVAHYDTLDEPQRALRDFERTYLACRVVSALRRNPAVESAYVSLAPTPSVDFCISGVILDSSGNRTSMSYAISAANAETPLTTRTCAFENAWEDFGSNDPFLHLYAYPGNRIGVYMQKDAELMRGRIDTARVFGYLGAELDTEAAPEPLRQLVTRVKAERKAALDATLYE
ncbi:MAG TPA: hypothetical protein VK824_11095, partial [Planctomycetota bacterium]|nr:hypothetical protein [Planctomycetota bacterium]